MQLGVSAAESAADHSLYLSQMLQYEITRKQLLEKQQKKIDALEARAGELQKQKVEHEKAWASAQRERELQKVRCMICRLVWCQQQHAGATAVAHVPACGKHHTAWLFLLNPA